MYRKGAALLSLKRNKGELTTWQEVRPAFEGGASRSTCLQKEK